MHFLCEEFKKQYFLKGILSTIKLQLKGQRAGQLKQAVAGAGMLASAGKRFMRTILPIGLIWGAIEGIMHLTSDNTAKTAASTAKLAEIEERKEDRSDLLANTSTDFLRQINTNMRESLSNIDVTKIVPTLSADEKDYYERLMLVMQTIAGNTETQFSYKP